MCTYIKETINEDSHHRLIDTISGQQGTKTPDDNIPVAQLHNDSTARHSVAERYQLMKDNAATRERQKR